MIKTLIIVLLISFPNQFFAQNTNDIQEKWRKMNASKDAQYMRFNEAKFGMFIHWGAYSSLGGMWNGEKVPHLGEWIMYYGQISRKDYKEVCKAFNPVQFNAEEWVKLAKEAGMKYIVITAKHHDGFAMYDSDITDFNISDFTKFKRDPIQEIYDACKKYNISLGIYYSHSIDWMDGGDAGFAQKKRAAPGHSDHHAVNVWDPPPICFEEYIETKAKPQMIEILNKFPGLIEICYDFPRFMDRQQSYEFYELAYERQPQSLVNSRVGNNFGDFLVAGDNEIPTTITSDYRTWETPGTLNNTWGFQSYDNDWKSVDEVLYWLVDISSKGGNYLLNIGPDGNGVIPENSVDILKNLGVWMAINGEAIYGTSRWDIFREGPSQVEMKSTRHREEHGFDLKFTNEDFWFTSKDNSIYVISLAPPVGNSVRVKSLFGVKDQIDSIILLANNEKLTWKCNDNKTEIIVPSSGANTYKYGFVLKVKLK